MDVWGKGRGDDDVMGCDGELWSDVVTGGFSVGIKVR